MKTSRIDVVPIIFCNVGLTDPTNQTNNAKIAEAKTPATVELAFSLSHLRIPQFYQVPCVKGIIPRRFMRRYLKDAVKVGREWILEPIHVWACIRILGVCDGGEWASLVKAEGFQALEDLIGPMPYTKVDEVMDSLEHRKAH